MTTSALSHGTFTLQRTWAASPAKVFSAWSNPDLKAQWFGGPPGKWTPLQRSLDFRVGGQEIVEGRLNDGGALTYYEGRFHLIEPERRLIYSYALHHSGNYHSVALCSLLLEPSGAGTRLSYTEQIIFLDGHDGTADRQHGTELQLAALERML
jgi:uncharacterized protein YndB with AHSA1/START domain